MGGSSPAPWAWSQAASASPSPTAAPASRPPAIPAPSARVLMRPPPPALRPRPLRLRELEIELRRIARHAEPARRELVQVLRLPMEEAALLEFLHVRRERLPIDSEPSRESIPRVQIRAVGRRVVDAPVFEKDRALQVHGVGSVRRDVIARPRRGRKAPDEPGARPAPRPPPGSGDRPSGDGRQLTVNFWFGT